MVLKFKLGYFFAATKQFC